MVPLKWGGKYAGEKIALSVDWSPRMAADETIQSVAFTSTDDQLVITEPSSSGKVSSAKFAGGAPSNTSRILARVVTSTGRELEEIATIRIEASQ